MNPHNPFAMTILQKLPAHFSIVLHHLPYVTMSFLHLNVCLFDYGAIWHVRHNLVSIYTKYIPLVHLYLVCVRFVISTFSSPQLQVGLILEPVCYYGQNCLMPETIVMMTTQGWTLINGNLQAALCLWTPYEELGSHFKGWGASIFMYTPKPLHLGLDCSLDKDEDLVLSWELSVLDGVFLGIQRRGLCVNIFTPPPSFKRFTHFLIECSRTPTCFTFSFVWCPVLKSSIILTALRHIFVHNACPKGSKPEPRGKYRMNRTHSLTSYMSTEGVWCELGNMISPAGWHNALVHINKKNRWGTF